METSTNLVRWLIGLAGPSGEERAVTSALRERIAALGLEPETDPKGNLLLTLPGDPKLPHVVVTAHLDEIALIITGIDDDGKIRVQPIGGTYTWKWGEGPVEILTRGGPLIAVLSYGGIHTNHEKSVVEQARHNPLPWTAAYLFTGMSAAQLKLAGVRTGLRVVMARSRRALLEFGEFVAGYFLDDRADLAAWLLAIQALHGGLPERLPTVTFAATTSEEVGAEGALYLLRTRPADICVALEIGPKTPDADFPIDASPTIWVRDGYAAMEAIDGELLADCCEELAIEPHWQYLSRGGSDASCAASKGITARAVTLGLPVENSHGYEIMHRDAPGEMVRLLLAYLRRIGAGA
ncbi:MAG TPA: M20/M25/M40 family metallo-hydrolase [Chthonomonadaceae bacterium]|nr:M20/M25/M40 family metallo-hydrolase [Chthonomonadaceae bacterium]